MPDTTPTAPAPPREHIFPATELTRLAKIWKELTAENKNDEALEILEQIIIGSTPMFERLAQYEGFHHSVDLSTLVQSAREKVVRWLANWNPKHGKDGGLFTWFSICAKHSFLSELAKSNQFKKRFHVTSDNLEKFYGAEDHAIHKDDAAEEVRKNLKDISARWGDPQYLGAIRYAVECLIEDRPKDKAAIIKGMCYGYGLNQEMGKFFYNWAIFAMRDALHERIHIPFTKEDLFRHRYTFTQLVDLLTIITWPQFERLVATMGGSRLKIPTLEQLNRLHQDYLLHRRISKSDMDPETVAKIAKDDARTPKNAADVYEEMTRDLNPDLSGEHEIFE